MSSPCTLSYQLQAVARAIAGMTAAAVTSHTYLLARAQCGSQKGFGPLGVQDTDHQALQNYRIPFERIVDC